MTPPLGSGLWSAVSERERSHRQQPPVSGQAQPLRPGLCSACAVEARRAVEASRAVLGGESGQCQSPEVRAGVTTV